MVKLGEFLDMTSEYVRPISIALQNEAHWLDALDGEMTKVCGWGKISLRPQVYPDELHCVDVPIGKFKNVKMVISLSDWLESPLLRFDWLSVPSY